MWLRQSQQTGSYYARQKHQDSKIQTQPTNAFSVVIANQIFSLLTNAWKAWLEHDTE